MSFEVSSVDPAELFRFCSDSLQLVLCSWLERADEGFFLDYVFALGIVEALLDDLEASARARLVVDHGAIADCI